MVVNDYAYVSIKFCHDRKITFLEGEALEELNKENVFIIFLEF